ncbi:MAG: 4'-phosphopantetheinyl transferase superfamily protein [Ferruginibacter sp.]|nr:4'-phosphopantetheinyl transferase superfamily protein [Ferruginibacter sp.]
MPLVYQQNINAHTKIGVWHIVEDENFFLNQVSLQRDIKHPKKRLQHLAGRLLLLMLFDDFPLSLIEIASSNKPYLRDQSYHFSISHCGDYAAAVVSTENRVGVDIEIPTKKILSVFHKFMDEYEHNLFFKNDFFSEADRLTICWSIKEAMYKWDGNTQLDFKKHLHIRNIEYNLNAFRAYCVISKYGDDVLIAEGLFFNGNCLVWIVN